MPYLDVVSSTASSGQAGLTAANNLRIASISVAAYDFLTTIPAEYRLYKTTSRRSLGFILFVLIRYLSIIVITISNTGFFYHHFSPKACAHYAYVAPVFKVFQVMVSHAILGVRTYNIAHRNRRLGHILGLTYLVVIVVEWVAELNGRYPMMTNLWGYVVDQGNCVIATPHPDAAVSAWTFYFSAMLFDFLTLSISTYYLLKARTNAASAASKLVNILLYDGLGYFVVLTAVNMTNVFLYRRASHAIQSAGVSLAYAFVWIMSQRILIHVREVRAQQASAIVSPRPTCNTSTTAVRSDGQTKHELSINTSLAANLPVVSYGLRDEFDIEVRIERAMIRDAMPPYGGSTDQELYATPHNSQDCYA